MTEARGRSLDLWSVDISTAFEVGGLDGLTERHVIMPKLFRRLADHVIRSGSATGFREALEANREPVLHLPDGNFTHFDTFVEQGRD